MEEQLHIALKLQAVENRRKSVMAELEAAPQVLDLTRRKAQEHETALQQARVVIDAGRKERRRLEGEIEAIKAKIAKYRDQLMGVKTNKEYAALLHEIEEQNSIVRGVEDRILEIMEDEEKLGAEVDAREQQVSKTRSEALREEEKVDAAAKDLSDVLRRLEAERGELRAALDKEILGHFDRVFSVRGGVAVVGVKGESCEGCRVRIRPQVLAEMRQYTRMHVCDNCKRILVYEPAAEEPAAGDPGPGGKNGQVVNA